MSPRLHPDDAPLYGVFLDDEAPSVTCDPDDGPDIDDQIDRDFSEDCGNYGPECAW